MLAVRRLPSPVIRQGRQVRDRELLGDSAHNDLRHIGRPGQERAQKPDGAELDGEPKPVVVPPAAVNQRPVAVVEVKEPISSCAADGGSA